MLAMPGDRHITFVDGRVVILPTWVKLVYTGILYQCGRYCGPPPMYVLESSHGKEIAVFGDGYVPSGQYINWFPFLLEIWPQDQDAPVGNVTYGAAKEVERIVEVKVTVVPELTPTPLPSLPVVTPEEWQNIEPGRLDPMRSAEKED